MATVHIIRKGFSCFTLNFKEPPLQQCHQCAKELDSAFTFCPYCGVAQPSRMETVSKTNSSLESSTGVDVLPGWITAVADASKAYRDITSVLQDKEWFARQIPGNYTPPHPIVRVCTPFFQALRACVNARANYEEPDLARFTQQFAGSIIVQCFFSTEERYQEIDQWKVVLDPDGERIHSAAHDSSIDFQDYGSGGWGLFHWLSDEFRGLDVYTGPRRDLTIAVVRSFRGEIRYVLPAAAR